MQTLQVVEHLSALSKNSRKGGGHGGPVGPIEVAGLAAGRNIDLLVHQARDFGVPAVAIASSDARGALQDALPGVKVFAGSDAAERMVQEIDATDVSAAVVGSAGLPATIAAIRKGMRVGLANKETLVAAGALVTPMVKQHRAQLIPVDSEHSAIFQCLNGQAGRTDSADRSDVQRIVLTASGGPFLHTPIDEVRNATVEQALRHPTWKMGPKITIDSATMMNKALEIIEAHWLFGLGAEKIGVIIHPQSIVHSFVEFADRSVLAQMGPPDMRTPIQYALSYPHRPAGCSDAMDWPTLTTLEFHQPDPEKFPSLGLAYRVIEAGGTAGAVFNAANEAAVAAFLEHKIKFGRIVELVAKTLDAIKPQPVESLQSVLDADAVARRFVDQMIEI